MPDNAPMGKFGWAYLGCGGTVYDTIEETINISMFHMTKKAALKGTHRERFRDKVR